MNSLSDKQAEWVSEIFYGSKRDTWRISVTTALKMAGATPGLILSVIRTLSTHSYGRYGCVHYLKGLSGSQSIGWWGVVAELEADRLLLVRNNKFYEESRRGDEY